LDVQIVLNALHTEIRRQTAIRLHSQELPVRSAQDDHPVARIYDLVVPAKLLHAADLPLAQYGGAGHISSLDRLDTDAGRHSRGKKGRIGSWLTLDFLRCFFAAPSIYRKQATRTRPNVGLCAGTFVDI
jgi:hypothetical protein